MLFESLQRLGVVAALSQKTDGTCSLRTQEDRAKALEHRAAFCARFGLDSNHLVCAQQVHSATVALADNSARGRGACDWASAIPATDGIVTTVPALPLALLVADCVPVYLVDVAGRAAGLLHAGRRGTLRNVAGRGVSALREHFHTMPAAIHAVIGPSAGPCCYEVSPTIADAFAAAGLPTAGRRLNLWEANRAQLVAAGVPATQITVTGICTICDGRFYSYRAGDRTQRNMALLAL